MAMAVAMERLSTLPGVTEVTVNLSHQEPSVLVLQATTGVPAARISECLRPVGARLVGAECPGVPGIQPAFARSA